MILMLMGCGGLDNGSQPPSLLVLTPLPTSTVQGDCDEVATLENWIQTLVFNQVEFDNFLATASGKSRAALYTLVKDLNTVALTVADTPILSCGEEAYSLTIAAMQQTLTAMQAYVNAERQDLEVIILGSQRNFELAQESQNRLIAQLDAMYQGAVNTPTQLPNTPTPQSELAVPTLSPTLDIIPHDATLYALSSEIVRGCPSSDCQNLGRVNIGMGVRVIGMIDGEARQPNYRVWYQIEWNNTVGFIYERGLVSESMATIEPVANVTYPVLVCPRNCDVAQEMGWTAQMLSQCPHLDSDGDGVVCYAD
jgi:hypothetical protein